VELTNKIRFLKKKDFRKAQILESFLAYITPRVTMSVRKKNSAHSVQPFGRPEGTHTRMSCIFYYIDLWH